SVTNSKGDDFEFGHINLTPALQVTCSALESSRLESLALFRDQPSADFSTLGTSAQVSQISQHIENPMKQVINKLNSTIQVVEMIVIETSGDFRKGKDIAKTNCTSIPISDYRHESSMLDSNISSWYRLVRALRLVGQIVFALVVGCYYAISSDTNFDDISRLRRIQRALGILLRIPAQVIIYGSWFPVLLFVSAHYIDSTAIYLFIFRAFTSPNGDLQLT
ncbi:hypothetical protein THRCLA_10440, partial [Thraustotheca clavata]